MACRTLFAVCPTCLCFYKMKKLFWVSPKQLLHDVFDAHRSELEKLANNSACDIIGLVTFVGRVERVKGKGKGKRCSYLVCCVEVVFDNWKNLFWSVMFTFLGPEKYWTYRWVHAVDGTSDHPFILELFSTSQAEIFSHICPSKSAVSSLLPHCKHASFFKIYPLFHSDLPGLHSDEGLSCGRLVAVPHEQLWDWDVHHRLEQAGTISTW